MSTNSPLSEYRKRQQAQSDVSEFVRTARAFYMENNPHFNEQDFPLEEDAALDIASGFISNWIVLCGNLPVDTKAQFITNVEPLIVLLREVQGHFSDEPAEFKEQLLQMMKASLIPPNNAVS